MTAAPMREWVRGSGLPVPQPLVDYVMDAHRPPDLTADLYREQWQRDDASAGLPDPT